MDTDNNNKIFYVDALDDIADDIHSISEIMYTIGENADDSENGHDIYGELTFLAHSLKLVREELHKTMDLLRESNKIIG